MRRFLAIRWIVRFVPSWFVNVSINAVILRIMPFGCIRYLQLIRLVFVLLDLSSMSGKCVIMKRPLQNPNVNIHALFLLRPTERP